MRASDVNRLTDLVDWAGVQDQGSDWVCKVCGHTGIDVDELGKTLELHVAQRHALTLDQYNDFLKWSRPGVKVAIRDMDVRVSDISANGGPDPRDVMALITAASLKTGPLWFMDTEKGRNDTIAENYEDLLMGRALPNAFEQLMITYFVSNVSRALTHQVVRARHASYVQQTLRVVDPKEQGILIPPNWLISEKGLDGLDDLLNSIWGYFEILKADGVATQDARYILPIGVSTNIVCVFPYASLVRIYGHRGQNHLMPEHTALGRAYRYYLHKMFPELALRLKTNCERAQSCMAPMGAVESCGRFPGGPKKYAYRQEATAHSVELGKHKAWRKKRGKRQAHL